ncbi:ABC1 family-domain-containing protein [Hyaloraphidium curvatum]|nr:ABC1 family-domain-containing protein [Hyaloraphidium curvatum]
MGRTVAAAAAYSAEHAAAAGSLGRHRPRSRRRRFTRGALWSTLGAFGLLAVPLFLYFSEHPKAKTVTVALTRSMRAAQAVVAIMLDYKLSLRKGPADIGQEEYDNRKSDCHKRSAMRLYEMARRNGGVFIKLGQHIAAMGYILPHEYVEAMRPLQDKCPPTTVADIDAMVQLDLGKSLDELFSSFDPEPLGVASLAQVHRAVLRETGQEVAVKFQHPYLEAFAEIDIQTVTSLVHLVKRLFPAFSFAWLADQMQENLPKELDFRIEASNAAKLASLFTDQGVLHIPAVYWAQKRVMAMEFIHGARIDDRAYLRDHAIDPVRVSYHFSEIFSRMIFREGFVHADPHPGNVLVRPRVHSAFSPREENFQIVLLDHGLYRTLDAEFRFMYAQLWSALIRGDEEGIEAASRDLVVVLDGGEGPGADEVEAYLEERKHGAEKPKPKPKAASGLARARSSHEKEIVSSVAGTGEFLLDIADILAKVPRELLLLLKTNDLLRAVDEDLGIGVLPDQGLETPSEHDSNLQRRMEDHMVRMVTRMGWWVARAVYQGRKREVLAAGGNRWLSPAMYAARWEFWAVTVRLWMAELWLGIKGIFGL